jgi:trimeric autotransporter adhesin
MKGLVTTVSYGTTTITASYGSHTVTRTLTVQSPSLTSITVAPSPYTIASGTAVQLHATATYSDNTTQDVSAPVSWSSTDNTVATLSTSVLATGVNPGTVTVTATLNGVSGAASLTVQ